ncbi:MAG: type II toxin-antitoxin system VapC family toxin [Candidatus Rokubacteria bacterium]|nr:type II toxin-antitoxin system VapC family toxin [Candidatus Rokubacteria bacterium]
MILVDANLLVYARVAELPQHAAARDWLDAQLNGTTQVGLPWQSVTAFLRIVTNPRVFERAATITTAWNQVERWLDREPVWVPTPTERHREILARLLPDAAGRPDLVPDAHLAALALEHGLTLYSTDGDFARFRGLRWENPLRPRERTR